MSSATMALLGTIGIWLLVAGVLVIVIEMVLVAVWGVAMGRRIRALGLRVESERAGLQADVARLKLALEETKRLWRPYRRILRWLQHPLIVALWGSYRRRMAAR